MRSDENEAADAVVLVATCIDRCNRGAVAVTDQKTATESNRIEQRRQRFARLVMHIGEWPRQIDWRRVAVAGTRIDENTDAGRRRQLVREIVPKADAAKPLMHHHQRGGLVGPWTDQTIFQPLRADQKEAGIVQRHGHPTRSASSCATPDKPVLPITMDCLPPEA